MLFFGLTFNQHAIRTAESNLGVASKRLIGKLLSYQKALYLDKINIWRCMKWSYYNIVRTIDIPNKEHS